MRARGAAVLTFVLVVLVQAAPASAGGSWLDPDRRVYVPSETAVLRGSFDLTGTLDGRLSDGPFTAYLLRVGTVIRPGRVPAQAVPIGELEIVRTHSAYPTHARIAFRVPDVPTGSYYVGYCNDPCTMDGVGDLVGSWDFVIAATRGEGLALIRRDHLAEKVDHARSALMRARAQRDRLERDLAVATTRIGGLEAQLDAEVVPLPAVRPQPVIESSVTWWVAALACLAGLALGAALARRRSEPSIVVPDTVPDELDERVFH